MHFVNFRREKFPKTIRNYSLESFFDKIPARNFKALALFGQLQNALGSIFVVSIWIIYKHEHEHEHEHIIPREKHGATL